ncbi:hypothetical protein OC834_002417 [Tilletia horrida]|nr:hypothetical protein OC835_005373 [Tilletia horrida]KAK0532979.1 hypothetical protein OC834_002417 [Tilletia horrida]
MAAAATRTATAATRVLLTVDSVTVRRTTGAALASVSSLPTSRHARTFASSCPACNQFSNNFSNSNNRPRRRDDGSATPSAQQQQYQQQQRRPPRDYDQDERPPQSAFDSLTAIGAPVYQRNNNSSGGAAGANRQQGPIRDTDIRSRWIYLVDFTGAAGGGLTGPHRTDEILSKLDRKKFWLQQVSAAPGAAKPRKPQDGQDNSSPAGAAEDKREELQRFPVCKIVAKKDEFDQARSAAKRKAEGRGGGGGGASSSSSSSSADAADSAQMGQTSSSPSSSATSTSGAASHKDLQLTWTSTQHDMSYKIAKAKRDLLARAPNSRLTIRIATKRGTGRHVGTPGTPYYVAEQARKKKFLDELHAAICAPEGQQQRDTTAGAEEGEDAALDTVADIEQPVPGGVARLSSEGVQWRGQGSMAILVYEPVV